MRISGITLHGNHHTTIVLIMSFMCDIRWLTTPLLVGCEKFVRCWQDLIFRRLLQQFPQATNEIFARCFNRLKAIKSGILYVFQTLNEMRNSSALTKSLKSCWKVELGVDLMGDKASQRLVRWAYAADTVWEEWRLSDLSALFRSFSEVLITCSTDENFPRKPNSSH